MISLDAWQRRRRVMAALLTFLLVGAPLAEIRAAAGGSAYTRTRHPLVLVPGAVLFDLPFEDWSYWYGIVEALQDGGAEVYVSKIPVGTDEVRGEILLQEVATILAMSGHSKVNLLGYSQGGQTARYVATVAPEMVASVTTISAPNGGSGVADFLTAIPVTLWQQQLKQRFLDVIYRLSRYLSVLPHDYDDFSRGLAALSRSGAERFNVDFPAGLPAQRCEAGPARVGDVYYFSWGGVGSYTNPLDVSDLTFLVTSMMFKEANDGMVARCDNHLGTVVRDDFRQNHFDGINQMFGLSAWRGVNPKTIYRSHANRLKNLGL